MYEYKCTIKRVIDGDTFVADIALGFGVTLQKQTFRLYGIDTPESRRNSAKGIGDAHVAHGLQAKARVQELIGPEHEEYRTLTVRTHKDKGGKYGRWLADVLCPVAGDARSLTEILKDEGLEKKATYEEEVPYAAI
jgi:endonuclease YncB( thermonuclease family)|tara:strand:+ start:377 stop:784 length:408 start_codon:yes stop_codon:yes gene_type:complete